MEYVKLTNRTSRNLRGTWDGRIYQIDASKSYQFPRTVAEAIKRQNPIMGSEDPYDMTMEYLVGIEEDGDNVSPLSDAQAFTQEIERWNRKKLVGAPETEVVKGTGGLYAHERNTSISNDGPAVGGFVKA